MKKVFISLIFILPFVVLIAKEPADSLKLHQLQEVEIIAVRATEKTPLTYSGMNKNQIEKVNFGQDIPILLTLTPSLVATSDAGTGIGYTNFRIRGTDANRINITVNGIPMNDAESHGVFWVNMPDFASSIEDLQIQRGVGTSTNGAGAFGASINLKTEKIPSKSYGIFDGSYGSFHSSKASLKLGTGQIANHWAFDARISGINSDGYIDRASVHMQSYFTQASYYNDNTLLKLIIFGGKEKTYHAWDGVPKDSLQTNRTYNPCGLMGYDSNGKPMFYDNQTDNYIQTNYQLNLVHLLNPDLNLNTSVHYTKGDGYYEEYKEERKLEEYNLTPFVYNDSTMESSDLVRQKHLDNYLGGLVFSLNYKKSKWDATLGGGANYYLGNHFGKVTWVKNYAGDESFFPGQEYYRSKAKKTDVNIYLKSGFQATSALNLYVDLQYRYINYKIDGQNDIWDWNHGQMQQLNVHDHFNFFNPKTGIFYQFNNKNEAFASFAIGNREPNRNNYTNAGPGEKPTSERLYDYEAGYRFKNQVVNAGINLYYMKYHNQLILTGKINEIGEMLTSNISDSYRMGVELTAGFKINSWLKWSGNLTISKNEIKDYTAYVDLYDSKGEEWQGQVERPLGTTPISFSPEMTAGSLFSFLYQNWNAGFQSNYVGKQFIDNTGSDDRKLDPYFINNLMLEYTFYPKYLKSLSIGLLVNNLFNEQYETNAWVYSYYMEGKKDLYSNSGFFPQAGTNFLVRTSIRF